MISLSDAHLQIVMRAAYVLPIEKRDVYLQCIAAMLVLRGCGHFDDADVTDPVVRALNGMTHQAARVRVCVKKKTLGHCLGPPDQTWNWGL